jgi:signal transduction histidine kinase
MIGAVWKLIIFTNMVNGIINTSSNGRIILQVYDTCPKMFDVRTLGHTAHIEAIVQLLPSSDQHVGCDGLQSRRNPVLQIRYARRLWWHKHIVLHLTPKEVVTRG